MRYRERRFPAEYAAVVVTSQGQLPALLLDVNIYGAHLRCAGGLHAGAIVRLGVLGQQINASVRWADRNEAGIAFRPQIPQALVDRISHCHGSRSSQRRFDSSQLFELR